ncbi:MAG: VOC family protein [Acidobacteriaceae bacterium]|nr:VOC family protein [Acidobacteriaceae bacterium]MBV9780081.1 VOC family protein [Acidobacteriaceae bacterium]
MSLKRVFPVSLLAIIAAGYVIGQGGEAGTIERPPIVGVAHIGLKTNDIAAADQFYGHDLGYDHFSLDKPTGSLMLNYYKVNDHQYIEIFPELRSEAEDRLSHIAFETGNIQKLRDYLASRDVKVPESLKTGLDGNVSMMIKDPDGHNVEFVQYMPGSLHSRNFGKLLPGTRVSNRMIHVGVTVQDRAVADRFYKDILGFKLMWYGGMKDDRTDWVDMRVPEGTDWLEYMLNVHNPSPKQLGVMHHLALGVENVKTAYKTVLDHGFKPREAPKIGRDGKWQLNLYDPNYTRAELMEFKPVETPCCSPMLSSLESILQIASR